MAKSSLHFDKSKVAHLQHSLRESFTHNKIFEDEENEYSTNFKDAIKFYRSELKKRVAAYTNRTNQKLQKKTNTLMCAIINLNSNHKLQDLEDIKKYIEDTLDTKVISMSIHRDEGKLKNPITRKILSGNNGAFLNPKDHKIYSDKKYTKKIDLEKYKIEKNYHAHIEFLGLDSKGYAIKRNYLNKFYLSKTQDFVAKTLKMERGHNYKKENIKSKKRLDSKNFKLQQKEVNNMEVIAQKFVRDRAIINNNKNKQLEEENLDLEVENGLILSAIEEAKEKSKQLEEENKRILAAIEKVKEKNKKLEEANKRILAAVEEEKNKNKKLEEKLATLENLKTMNNKIRKNMQQLQAKRKDYAEFEQLVKELKTKIKNKELTINELKNELKDRYKDINLLELKMKDDETTIEESKTQIIIIQRKAFLANLMMIISIIIIIQRKKKIN